MIVILFIHLFLGKSYVIITDGGAIIFMTLSYIALLSNRSIKWSAKEIAHKVSFIYKTIAIAMAVEIMIIIFGLQGQLAAIFGSKYIIHNATDFFKFLGFNKATGLNSLFFGNQIAAMLSVFSLVWFLGMTYRDSKKAFYKNPFVLLAFINLLFSLNGLGVLLIFLFFIVLFFIFVKYYWKSLFSTLGLFLSVIFYCIDKNIILSKIFDSQIVISSNDKILLSKYTFIPQNNILPGVVYYYECFISPIKYWFSLNLIDKLFGKGFPYFLSEQNLFTGECGTCVALIASGLIWWIIFFGSVLFACLPGLRIIKSYSKSFSWLEVRQLNAVLTILWAGSTIHYTSAFTNSGAMAMFSMHMSLVIYSHYRLVRVKSL